MANKTSSEIIKSLGIATAQQIQKKLGVSQPTLSRWVKSGQLIKLSHGFYVHPKFEIPPESLEFAIACAKFGPQSAIGGLTALFHYGLTDQPPAQVWMVVPPLKAYSSSQYRTLRTKTSLKLGIDTFKLYRIVTMERAIIEALKFSTKIGQRTAINAARTALREGKTTEKKLGEMANKLKLRSFFEKYWESIVA
ncbi:MAG: type IV toxin-antitoxin system AbiEi family antitoxin domain-containing protein [Bdellovibrionales bacterium]|nr:type IV toxin-antitoxin system AbiEi family antitoxin domain-containing protein [Bdellovibrionales bacterium]